VDTTSRGYRYPQCDPPLTEDAADIVQLRNLALDVENDLIVLDNRASDIIVTPDGCLVAQTAPVAYLDQDFIDFNVVGFDNSPGNVMGDLVNDGIRIRQAGLYLITSWINSNSSTVNVRSIINIVGIGDNAIGEPSTGAGAGGHSIAVVSGFLAPGTFIKQKVGTTSAVAITIDMARLAVVRLI
jgi:hypothetical protein